MKSTAHGSALCLAALLACMAITASAQTDDGAPLEGRSAIRDQSEHYARYSFEREEQWDSLAGRDPMPRAMGLSQQRACSLQRTVFGWHPYWSGTAYEGYDYSLLSDICYFSYDVDPATGGYKSIHSWKTTPMVDRAREAGVRVHLCVVLFSDHALFLSNAASRARLMDSLVALVKLRGAQGVNVDFEAVPSSQRLPFTTFMVELANRFHRDIPGSRVSIALPAVDWSNTFDVATMAQAVDLFIIMGYDYHWSSSDNSGPVSPKNNGSLWSAYDVTRSVNYYLAKGIPPARLALGLPYYGYDWATADDKPASATSAKGTAVVFSTARQRAATHGRRWDESSSTPWYAYRADSSWRQCWYDDEVSLRMKYEMTTMKNIGGIGIWALGYDGTNRETWDAIRDVFTDCPRSPCSGSFTDMGGPTGDYYNNDSFTYTIAPENARSVRLAFRSFSVADDELAIYDGADTNAPLIGRYTAQNSPAVVTANSGRMTLLFRSNSTGTSWGWTSEWSCTQAPLGVDAEPTGRPWLAPNPASGAVTLRTAFATPGRVALTVCTMLGTPALEYDAGVLPAGAHEHVLDLAGLADGAYMVRIRHAHGTTTTMLLKR